MKIEYRSDSLDTITLYGVYVPKCEELFNGQLLATVEEQLNKKPSGFLDATKLHLGDRMKEIMANNQERAIYIGHLQDLLNNSGIYKAAIKVAYSDVIKAFGQAIKSGLSSGVEYTKYSFHTDLSIIEDILDCDISPLHLIKHCTSDCAYEISQMIQKGLVKAVLEFILYSGRQRDELSINIVCEIEKTIESM